MTLRVVVSCVVVFAVCLVPLSGRGGASSPDGMFAGDMGENRRALGTVEGPAAAQATFRTVYVTAVDREGQPVAGLTAEDFAVKEGGKDQEIVSVEPARARMRIALAIDEPLTASGHALQGMADLIVKLAPQADIALIVIGLSNRVMVPYTSEVAPHIVALRGMPQIPREAPSNVGEGIADLARAFEKEEVDRPVMVVLAVDSGKAVSLRHDYVLGAIRDSRAQLHVVAVSAGGMGGDLSRILSDGPRQSGGRQVGVSALSAVPRAMEQIATDLASQYLLTYARPDGAKPSDRLAVSMKRRGVTLRAPTRVPID